MEYEGGLEGSSNNFEQENYVYTDDDHNNSRIVDIERPIYDSKEDPIPKIK
jgi:hypothetical protein